MVRSGSRQEGLELSLERAPSLFQKRCTIPSYAHSRCYRFTAQTQKLAGIYSRRTSLGALGKVLEYLKRPVVGKGNVLEEGNYWCEEI